jgi:hypothetical protein
VRLTAAALLPALKHTIRLPEDVELLVSLHAAVSIDRSTPTPCTCRHPHTHPPHPHPAVWCCRCLGCTGLSGCCIWAVMQMHACEVFANAGCSPGTRCRHAWGVYSQACVWCDSTPQTCASPICSL